MPLVAVGAIGMALALLAVRLRFVRAWPHVSLSIAAGAGFAATVVGTIVDISGVLLAVIVGAAGVYAMWRSTWRLGDLATLVLATGCGIAVGYIAAAAIDPGTGSYGDQSALIVVGFGVLLSIATIVVEVLRILRSRQG